MPNIEKGVIPNQITIKRPSEDMVGIIIEAQAQHSNRVILAEWQDINGKIVATYRINPNIPRTAKEIRKLSFLVGNVDRLTVQEVSPPKS